LRIAPKEGVTNELGKELFAHTSPVYVTDEGKRRFDPAVAEEMLGEVEANWRAIERQGKFSNDTEKAVVAAVYTEAMETLRAWLAERR
jgi:hypothetical protein